LLNEIVKLQNVAEENAGTVSGCLLVNSGHALLPVSGKKG